MINYYEVLKISQSASKDEVRKAVNEQVRLWSNRTNAPQMERRQEAERMIKILEEAENILLDEIKRKDYDRKLKSAPREDSRVQPSAHHTIDPGMDLFKMGWDLLAEGNIAEAIYVAQKAIESNASNPDFWALSAEAKFRWKEYSDAVYEFKKAISLNPVEADFYFGLGSVYEAMGSLKEALQQYSRASEISPKVTMYKASVGIIYVRMEEYRKGLKILEECVQEEPENMSYKNALGITYLEYAYRGWTYIPEKSVVPSGYYATTKCQVETARSYIEKAENLGIKDREISGQIEMVKRDLEIMEGRKFDGNYLIAAAGILLGVAMLSDPKAIAPGAILFLSGILYIPSCFTPQYLVNRKIISGEQKAAHFLASMSRDSEGKENFWGCLFGLVFLLGLLPFVTVWNFIRNYLLTE